MQLYEQQHLLRRFPQILGLAFIYDYEYEYMRNLYTAAGHRPSPLIHACYWGLELVAQRLLEIDAHLVNADNIDSPLHAASFSGHHSIVKMLLDKGAAIDGCAGASPLTTTVPLHGAARNGHIEVVKTLLQYGARIDILGFEDETAIEVAVWYGHQIVVQLLMASCDSFSFHLLFSALSRSSLDHTVVDLLCSKPIVPDSRTTSLEFVSLLGKLIQNREAAYAKILLEKGSYVSIFSFEPHLYWPESPTEEEFQIKKKCCLIGV